MGIIPNLITEDKKYGHHTQLNTRKPGLNGQFLFWLNRLNIIFLLVI